MYVCIVYKSLVYNKIMYIFITENVLYHAYAEIVFDILLSNI